MVTAAPHITFDSTLNASLILQFVLSGLGMMTNGCILICLLVRPTMRTQPNFLVANLTCANFLVSLAYAAWAGLNLMYKMEPSVHLCMYLMAPTLFALNISLCCSVAVVHHRSSCCLLGYRSIHGVATIAERWQLMAASVSVWFLTFLGGAAVYIDIGSDGSMPICIYPVALQNSYLVPFSMFTCCVAGVIVLEHVRVLCLLIYALLKKPSSEKPNPIIIRSTFVLLTLFCLCWTPLNYISSLYLHPGASMYQEPYYYQAQWLCTLPLIHCSLVDPFVYALTEREYSDMVATALLAVCPFGLRWQLKRRLKRFDPLYRRKRKEPKQTDSDQEMNNAVPAGPELQNVRLEEPFSISRDVIEMQQVVVDVEMVKNRNGHVNMAYHTEYI